jgi:flagellar biogenesis protein FliO
LTTSTPSTLDNPKDNTIKITTEPDNTHEINMGSAALSTGFSLIFVLLLAFVILKWVARRYKPKGPTFAPKMISSTPIGPKEKIVCLEYHGKEYVLAIGACGLCMVDVFPLKEKMDPVGIEVPSGSAP